MEKFVPIAGVVRVAASVGPSIRERGSVGIDLNSVTCATRLRGIAGTGH